MLSLVWRIDGDHVCTADGIQSEPEGFSSQVHLVLWKEKVLSTTVLGFGVR